MAAKTVTLLASNKKEFPIAISAAKQSASLSHLLEDLPDECRIPLPCVHAQVLEKLVPHLSSRAAAADADEMKKLDEEFVRDASIESLTKLAQAVHYLAIEGLLGAVCQQIADIMKNKSVKWVRKAFHIKNDFTPEEEATITADFQWTHEGVDPDDFD